MALLTLGFSASTLDFAGVLEVAYPCLLRAVVSWKIRARLRNASSCRLPTFSHSLFGLGSESAATSSCATVVAASFDVMLGTFVCCGKNSTVSTFRSVRVLLT